MQQATQTERTMRNRAAPDMALHVAMEDPVQPEIIGLLRDGEENSARLYPAASIHHLAPDALRAANVRFFVARDGSGRAVATGALVVNGRWGELKRMWVVPDMRGKGISRAVLRAIEARARSERLALLRLETGADNHAALGLYERAGFRRRGPFADYRPDPLSVFMEKELAGLRGQ
jgi:putative acetyltransferase